MDDNSENDLNKKGEIKSPKDEEKDEAKYKRIWALTNDYINFVFRGLYNALKQPLVKLVLVIVIIIVDGIVFFCYGTQNGFEGLVAEGTLALAFVTYLQMKKSDDNIIK